MQIKRVKERTLAIGIDKDEAPGKIKVFGIVVARRINAALLHGEGKRYWDACCSYVGSGDTEVSIPEKNLVPLIILTEKEYRDISALDEHHTPQAILEKHLTQIISILKKDRVRYSTEILTAIEDLIKHGILKISKKS